MEELENITGIARRRILHKKIVLPEASDGSKCPREEWGTPGYHVIGKEK